MRVTIYNNETLLFRRQFLLGPRFLKGFPTWRHVEMRAPIRLTVHPDLPTYVARNGEQSILLLGYILDPGEPRANDADIVGRLLTQVESDGTPEAFIRLTFPFGGRWILIVDKGRDAWLFTDPCGYRQVFYTRMSQCGLWCASQPGLLAETLDLVPDGEAIKFIQAYRAQQPQYWWPGDSSLYKDVRHLMPNHYLDLRTGENHRFWPREDIRPRPLNDVVRDCAQILQGLIESASFRFELALGITAGKDTRLLLAASKTIRNELYCFTAQYWDLSPASPDILVPSRLLPKLGMTHHVIRCPSRMDKEFAKLYRRNVTTAHEAYGPIAEGMYHYYPQERMSMKGCGMPVTSGYYRLRLRHELPQAEREGIDAHALAHVARIPKEEFALQALDRWLTDASHRSVEGLDLLNLFLWEDREGNWQAMTQLEFDISREVFVPYNCRSMLANMLSLPEEHRMRPEIVLHRKMMLHLWPEVLIEPINPFAKQSMVSIARGFLRRPGCMNWRWLGSQIATSWLGAGATSKGTQEVEAPPSL